MRRWRPLNYLLQIDNKQCGVIIFSQRQAIEISSGQIDSYTRMMQIMQLNPPDVWLKTARGYRFCIPCSFENNAFSNIKTQPRLKAKLWLIILSFFTKGLLPDRWGKIWAGHPTYHVTKLKWEIIWTGGLITPPKRVTSPNWGPSTPCKQALMSKLGRCKWGAVKKEASMNTGNKIFGKHLRKIIHKNNV